MYGRKMKEVRIYNEDLQKKLSDYMNISVYTYSHYETEDTMIPIGHLINFCDLYKVKLDYIFEFDKEFININVKRMSNKEMGFRLKQFRKEFGLTQQKLATILNTTQSVIANYERGRNIIATPFLYEICKHYGVSADYLLGRTDSPKSYK